MSGPGRHGKPEEELFLQRPSTSEIPTVEPLRIHKRESASPEPPRAGSAASQRGGFSNPTTFPLPPGASSSAAPLPYPDDRQQPHQRPTNTRPNQPAYGDNGRMASPEPGRASPAYNSSSSPRSAGSADSGRQPGGGYPSALKSRGGRDGQQQSASSLAERRGNIPRPLPDSPGPDFPDKDGLFQRMPMRNGASELPATSDAQKAPQAELNPFPDYHQQYWPPPAGASSADPGNLSIPEQPSVNRFSSTASTSTTRAQRGSPPPPETPIVAPGEQPGGGIEARYAAAGIAGASTLTSLQAQNAAAAQRVHQYTPQPARGQNLANQQNQEPPRRPWTPTEQPGTQPHGPPTIYQGPGEAASAPQGQGPTSGNQAHSQPPAGPTPGHPALEQDFQRMHMSASPPPAYSSVSHGAQPGAAGTTGQGYPNEKRDHGGAAAAAPSGATPGIGAGAGATMADNSFHQGHPAFANDPRAQSGASPQPNTKNTVNATQQYTNASPGPQGSGPASPPPLPEGWIAHLDPNSGQYYYIHLPTQSTQWEFPKGPTPLNLNEPMSPTLSTYGAHPMASPGLTTFGGKPLGSPGFQPATPGYPESIMSISSATPTTAGFTGPPPSSGVDMYKVAPTNGVYFGPYLRYTNMDLERGLWLGSILLVTDAPQPPTIHIHQSVDLSPNPRQLKANPVYSHQRYIFYKYDIDLKMDDAGSAKWTYAITSHLGCTRYEFLVAGRYESSWRFIAHSGNDFSLNVNANERSRLGGVGYMWKDVMQKHVECGGFHAQLGLGDQIFADRLWKEITLLKQWLATSGKENRKNAPWTPKHEEEVNHAYFHYYTSHFDQPHLREAFAQIPHIMQIDDHDV